VAQLAHAPLEQVADRDGLALEAVPATLQPAEVEQVVDQPLQTVGGLLDRLGVPLDDLGGVFLLGQQLGVAEDRRDRPRSSWLTCETNSSFSRASSSSAATCTRAERSAASRARSRALASA
jgi:hypothetical protein